MENAIEIKDVNVQYDGVPVLENTTISIPYGTFTGVIGMNGAGKSTLFKVIMGLVKPTAGLVKICNDPPALAQKHGHVAYVPQTETVDWDFPVSVYEVVMMGRVGLQGVLKSAHPKDHEYVQKSLERVGMTDLAGRQIGELSGGQKKRVFVARALAQGAEILLLDEPFAGLDKLSEQSLTTLLINLKDEGKTIILATHELTSLPDICDRVALVRKTIIAYGPTDEVFTKELIGQTFDGIIHNINFDR